MYLIDGSQMAKDLLGAIADEILPSKIKPHLAIVFIGENPASEVYVQKKAEAGAKAGVKITVYRYISLSKLRLIDLIDQLSADKDINGIILQLPAPYPDITSVLAHIATQKDVDCLNPASLGLLWHDSDKAIIPATPRAVIAAIYKAVERMPERKQSIAGMNAVIINNSLIIGKPLAAVLNKHGATVTIAHSQTLNLHTHTKNADIVVCGTGKHKLIDPSMVKDNAIIVDSGFTKVENKIYGDIFLPDFKNTNCLITPVPGGVGPLGVAMLMQNTWQAAQRQSTS